VTNNARDQSPDGEDGVGPSSATPPTSDDGTTTDVSDSESQPSTGRAATPSARVERPYPRRTLEQALRVPEVIRQKNGGNPWPTSQIAEALDIKLKSSNFTYIISSSREYGLTETTRDDPSKIGITELGRRAVYPRSDEEQTSAMVEAFFSVEIFRAVVEHYSGNNLPERRFLENTLQTTFGLDAAIHNEFIDLFDRNCRFVGIGEDWGEQALTETGAVPKPAARAVTVATPTTPGSAPVCFVIMPFSERDDRYETGFFTEVFTAIFTPAITAAGFEVRTAKRQGSDIIQSTIVNELLRADLVLADLTAHNPNVLFELGMRMREDRPVALVRAKGTGPIFDVDNMLRVEEYNPNLWPSTVQQDVPRLAEHIKVTWDNRNHAHTFMKILQERS
jgi:hypothetical protein